MSLLGVYLTILAGPNVPVPLPRALMERWQSAEVTHNDEGRSGFQLTFQAGRGPEDLAEAAVLSGNGLRPFARVILMATFGVLPQVLMDGIITHQQYNPSTQPGTSTFTVTGEDVSVMMDRDEHNAEHPAQSEMIIAAKLILTYARYGLVPLVIPPPTLDIPLPIERIPVQQDTDLRYLQDLAARFNYVFYVTPGPAPGMNVAYWGPRVRAGLPQPALTFNMGPSSNVTSLDFQHDAGRPATVSGRVQDRSSNQSVSVQSTAPARLRLASQPPGQGTMRRTLLRASGLNAAQAMARAQAAGEASTEAVVTATGELSSMSYGSILQARSLVGLRGAGWSYDGLYYVKSVTHQIGRSGYSQRFTLAREGLGSTTPVVRP